MSNIPAILVNYNFDPTWLKDYKGDITIYDRSDDGIERNLTQYGKVYRTANIGDVDADKLGHLIEHYDTLPDVFLWGKTNLFKYITEGEWDAVKHNETYTPLLRQDHKTYADKFGQVNFYQGGMYYERADSWFFNAGGVDSKYFSNWQDWARHFGIPRTNYIPFPPGGNFILTKEKVHKYSRDFYDEMRNFLPHSRRPAEAQAAERSYNLIWQ